MKQHIGIAVLLMGLTAQDAAGYYPTPQGTSGLFYMTTAETLNTGEIYATLSAGQASYVIPGSSANNSELQAYPSILFGVADWLELGASAAFAHDIDQSNNGLRNLMGAVKLQLAPAYRDSPGIALSAKRSFNEQGQGPGATDTIGTGEEFYSGHINLTWVDEEARYHFSLGGGKGDIKVTSITGATYVSDNYTDASFGFEARPATNISFGVEATFSRKQHLKQLVLTPGLKYTTNHDAIYSLSVSYGIPGNRAEPESLVMASISIGLGRHVRDTLYDQMAEVTSRIGALETEQKNLQAGDLRKQLDALELRVNDLALTIAQLKQQQQIGLQPPVRQEPTTISPAFDATMTMDSNALRVEVVNASGVEALGDQVAALLEQQGYRITRIVVRRSPSRQSYVHYREGFSRNAIDIGHLLPRNQTISKYYNMPAGTDLVVIVGSDLKLMLRR